MATVGFGICLVVSVLATLFIALRNYDHLDSYSWSVAILLPFLIMGYWLKAKVTTAEAALVLFSFINVATNVLLCVIFFSMLHNLDITIRPWIKGLIYAAAFAQLVPVWLTFRARSPEHMIQITDTGDGVATRMTGGSFAFSHYTILLALVIVILGAVAVCRWRKQTYSLRILTFYTLLIGAGILIYVLESILDTDFSAMPYLYAAGSILLTMSYEQSSLHDISGLMAENHRLNISHGFVAIGLNGWFLSANEKSYDFLPELRKQRVDRPFPEGSELRKLFERIVENYEVNGILSTRYHTGEMICACEISRFTTRRNGPVRGYIVDIRDVTQDQKNFRILTDYNRTLNQEVAEKTRNIEAIQEKIVLSMADMVENRDSNTGGHVKRTSDIVRILVDDILEKQIIPLDEDFARDIVRAAPMHDLGKVSIDYGILNKPGRLTPEEYTIMKTHSTISGQMVRILLEGVEKEEFVNTAFHVARFHHERWDGKGYPEGLVGEMIPLEARIMAIADVYDALVSKRVYKEPMSFEKAAQIMCEGMGTQFDPNMRPVFISCREKLERYYSFV